MKVQIFLLASCFVLLTFADFNAIPFEECGEDFEGILCTVNSVTVDECDLNGKYCQLIRNEAYRMDMKFTPDFEGSDLTLLAYAMINGKAVSWSGMNGKACDYMACPITKGVPQSYVFNVNVTMSQPRGKFSVRWLMKQGGENRCCFANRFELI